MLEEFKFCTDPYLRGASDPFQPGEHRIILKTYRDSLESSLFRRIYKEVLEPLPNHKVGIDYHERSIAFYHAYSPLSRLGEEYKKRSIFEWWFENSELWTYIRALHLRSETYHEELVNFVTKSPSLMERFQDLLKHPSFGEVLKYKMGWYKYEKEVLAEVERERARLQKLLDGILSAKS